ncbi:phosphoethanolamine transferase [Yokenella regensburgei]|uniref:phosphoethanolamine transferase n=1 Tax=Yokenella regensburgei TaxID=158877 RepID=UPI001375C492|nr:phosphoethanolamine transferase [Yokenella regensburgei]KAF1368029.1 glucan phosphoethanolaminetransferase (alkaline phosphatase superfamily) [Yokenella regensburgei]
MDLSVIFVRKKQYVRSVSIHLIAIAFAVIFDSSFGFSLRPLYALAIYLLLITSANTKLFFYSITIALGLVAAIYAPISFLYGAPNINIVLSVAGTNTAESIEFIKAIPLTYYLHSASLVIMSIVLMANRTRLRVKNWKLPVVLALGIIAFRPVLSLAQHEQLDFDFTVAKFVGKIHSAVLKADEENRELARLINTKSTLVPTKASSRYDTYILVVGESARRDFMGSYGFSINNTPFMLSANGTHFNNYVSAASSTQTSLSTSFIVDGQPQNNIIRLAQKQGLETWWISNQGSHGNDDSQVSLIGKQADRQFFLKKGEYDAVNNDDRELMPYVKDALHDSKKSKLIVIHLMGSHPDFCTRTAGHYEQFYVNDSLSCYVQSIKNTDMLLQDIAKEAGNENKKWTMIYFSDHGLSFTNPDDKKHSTLLHGDKTKQNYAVPLFITSYNDTNKSEINAPYSAMDFLSLYLSWTGSSEKTINTSCNPLSGDQCANEDIKVLDFNHHLLQYSSLTDEPAQ